MEASLVTEKYVPRKSTRRDPWSEAEAREALAAASRSGLSLAAFARRHGLSDRNLYWWHMRICAHPDVHTGPLSFVPVVPLRAPARNGPATRTAYAASARTSPVAARAAFHSTGSSTLTSSPSAHFASLGSTSFRYAHGSTPASLHVASTV